MNNNNPYSQPSAPPLSSPQYSYFLGDSNVPKSQPTANIHVPKPQYPSQQNHFSSSQLQNQPLIVSSVGPTPPPLQQMKPKDKKGYTNILKQYEEEQLAKKHKEQLGIDFDDPHQQYIQQCTYECPIAKIPYSDAPIGNFYPAVEAVQIHQPIIQPPPQQPQIDPRDARLMKKFYPTKF